MVVEDLFAEHPRLVSFAILLVGENDAEDLVQEYYVRRLSGKVPPFEGRASHFTWLCAILKRTAREQARKGAAVQLLTYLHYKHDDGHAVEYDPVLDLRRHLAALCFDDRDILRFIEDGHTPTNIADEFGMTRGSIRTRLYRARKRLRERLT